MIIIYFTFFIYDYYLYHYYYFTPALDIWHAGVRLFNL